MAGIFYLAIDALINYFKIISKVLLPPIVSAMTAGFFQSIDDVELLG
jgi:hypothetical protein